MPDDENNPVPRPFLRVGQTKSIHAVRSAVHALAKAIGAMPIAFIPTLVGEWDGFVATPVPGVELGVWQEDQRMWNWEIVIPEIDTRAVIHGKGAASRDAAEKMAIAHIPEAIWRGIGTQTLGVK